ncbi:MAG: twin-arginine translocase subunit TatC [Oligoflexia bacterium]|nr:twin-arginine translocase subunit TatC [Oligoflexia bacterium]
MNEFTFTEHLLELRSRLIKILAIIFSSSLLSFFIGEKIISALLHPLLKNLSATTQTSGKVVYLGIFDKLSTQFQIALYFSIIVTSPLWLYQIWQFIKPALKSNELKIARYFLLFSIILFFSGIFFAYFLAVPLLISACLNFGLLNIEANINLSDYVLLVCKILILSGLLFQLPNVTLLLGLLGIVTTSTLRSKRRHIYFILSVIAAIITPPDVISMVLTLVPMVLLYELGIIAHLVFIKS